MKPAIRLYTSLVPGSSIVSMQVMQRDNPGEAASSVGIAHFTIGDQRYTAIEGGPLDPFNHSFSITVGCDEQPEIDRLWDRLKEVGSTERCGWLKDRWGVYWQIVPTILSELMGGSDPARARRVSDAMLKMTKFEIAELQRVAESAKQ
jgi:predicted 3-demethylubiquinone-9 3-methyltransferase (glyoxalase superfamily)